MLHRLSIVLIVSLLPVLAFSRSNGLWTEKSKSARMLAEVPDFSALAQSLIPAVVAIEVEQKAQRSRSMGPGFNPFEEFFRQFGVPTPRPGKGMGTGFVIQKDGLIVTNNHVIENADRINVSFWRADGREETMAAKVVGRAPNYDVALLQTVEPANAQVASLGNSDGSRIGDWVMAIGTPFGLSHSVSVGIISQKDRRDIRPGGSSGIFDFIQTDAAINPGNSGGPLINMKGEVIGVNTAINAQGTGIGFAIPINMVKSMLPELKSKGRFQRSGLGIQMEPNFTNTLAKTYGLSSARGVLVAGVMPGSPAAQGGLREGDVILTFDGLPLRDSDDLRIKASMAGVGKKVPMRIWRGGRERTITVTLGAMDKLAQRNPAKRSATPGPVMGSNQLGITVEDLADQTALKGGALITEVESGSPAHREGLVPGDIIVALDGKPVENAQDFVRRLNTVRSGDAFRLKIQSRRRGGAYLLGMIKP